MKTMTKRPVSHRDIGKAVRFELVGHRPSPNLERARFKPSEKIPSVDIIWDTWIDPKTGKERSGNRTIQYIPGEKSIYRDEQSEAAQEKDAHKLFGEIYFYESEKFVEPTETLLLEFLRRCNWNEGTSPRMPDKPVLFREYKPESIAQKLWEKEEEELEARTIIKNMSLIDLTTYYRVLFPNVAPRSKEINEMRWDMRAVAMKDVKAFLGHMQNPVMKRKFVVLSAIDYNILDKNIQTNTISWIGGGPVIKGRPGEDVVDALVEWSLSNEEGESIYSSIADKVRPIFEDEYGEQAVREKEAEISPDKAFEAFINQAIEREIIRPNGPAWTDVGDMKRNVNIKKIGEWLKKDKQLYEHLREKMAM